MFVEKPKLHPMAAAAIESLKSKGLSPSPSQILWLHDAAMRIKRATTPRIGELIDWPIECGGIDFYPLSIAAHRWLASLPADMQESPYAQAFACAYSRDEATLRNVATPMKARFAVWAWRARLFASKKALGAVLRVVMGDDERVEVQTAIAKKPESGVIDSPLDWGAFVFNLCRLYPGTTPHYWVFEVSLDFALDAMSKADDEGIVKGHEVTQHAAFRSIFKTIESELIGGLHAG